MSDYENDEDEREREINLSTTRLSPISSNPPERVHATGEGKRAHLFDQNTQETIFVEKQCLMLSMFLLYCFSL